MSGALIQGPCEAASCCASAQIDARIAKGPVPALTPRSLTVAAAERFFRK